MTIYVENETDFTFPFDTKELCSRVAEAVLDAEGCPYETEINVLITDNEGIRLYNKEYRNIDRETDVLSFPNIPFESGFFHCRRKLFGLFPAGQRGTDSG